MTVTFLRVYILEQKLVCVKPSNVFQLSLKFLAHQWQKRHSEVIEKSQTHFPDLSFCLKVGEFLEQDPDCQDTVKALYYMLNIMSESNLR